MNKKIQVAAISGAILFSIFVLTSSDNETSIPLPKPNSYSENDAVMILAENPQKKFDYQNQLRGLLGLSKRSQPEFNLLIDENNYIQTAKENGFELIYNDDFSSLHDLLLYVLIPSINGGKIDYDHPILKSATNLSLKIFQNERNAFSNFGQNRLYYFARKNTS